MSNNLKKEIEELRTIVEKLVRDVERLKKETEGKERLELKGVPLKEEQFVDYILKALEKALEEKPDTGLVFVGGIERKDGKIVDSFFSGIELKDVIECPPKKVVKVIAPLSNENRIRILQELLKNTKTSSELSSILGLEGGQLYHHLKELMLAGYIETIERGKYALTSRGCIAIRTIAGLASIPGMVTPTLEEIEEKLKEEKQ